jgi:tetratricopeptide (TPR) repeat protein
MNGGRNKRGVLPRRLATWLLCLSVTCYSGERPWIDRVVVFEGQIPLERGAKRDTARREYPILSDATYVAIVEEDDFDAQVRLEQLRPGKPTVAVEVESRLMGEGIEVAALDVTRGDRLVLVIEGPREFDRPGRIPLRLLRFDARALANAAAHARVEALRAWTAATRADIAAEEVRNAGFRNLDAAISLLQSPDGDPHLAAWARLVRANFSYAFTLGYRQSLIDARLAREAFVKLGDARNTARARYAEATALIEIGLDQTAMDPGPEEAGREGLAIFRALVSDPALSARERARSINNLGYNAAYMHDLAEAQEQFARGLAAFRAIGDRDGARMSLSNLGAIAGERGELQTSVRSFDDLVSQIDEIALPERRASYLWNGGQANLSVGNTDRAIERFLLLLELAREFKMPPNEARALQGLAMAYRKRGDLAQATTLIDEGLKVRRQIGNIIGIVGHLQSAGDIARETGDIPKALALHREALGLATSNDSRMRMQTQIALDYAASGDYASAIESCRAALAMPRENTLAFRQRSTELALAEALLARTGRSPKEVKEATTLATHALEGAIESADMTMEQSARRVLAQARAASGDLPEARREYERAISLIFRYRATTVSPEQQSTVLTHTQDTFKGYIDLLMEDVAARGPGRLQAASSAAEDALRVLESARVIDFDAVRIARVDAASQARIDELLTQMGGRRIRMATIQDRLSAPGPELAALQLDIAKLRAEIDMERVRGAHASGAAAHGRELTQPWPPVRAGVTQLSYALGERFAYLWVRDASGIRATVLARSPAAIERELIALAGHGKALSPAAVVRDLEHVSSWLLPEGSISSAATQLEIVAEGKIASVPFAALRSPANRLRRIAEDHSVVMISSMFESTGAHSAPARHPTRFVGVAGNLVARGTGSRGGAFPALAAPDSETRSIAALFEHSLPAVSIKLLSGEQGNADNVRASWSAGSDVFHFATHGLADLRQPLASLLTLPATDATGNPRYLTAGQVQEWRGDADLVYLSACETAVGPAGFADGIPGLQRAFLRAGAHGVIATLWPVEDVYASQFATDFYQRYAAGVPAAQALSETQREWATAAPGDEQPYRRITAWAHVYYTR